MAPVRQTNFSAGELSPLLWGRTDLPVFRTGLRTCRNFVITRHGSAMSRPGTTYVATTKSAWNPDEQLTLPGGVEVDKVRLVRFVAAADSSFVLVFGHRYVRFCTQGEVVLDAGGNVYEVATPYSVLELADLKFAQTGDVLTICSPNHDARELTHFGTTSWTMTTVSFAPFLPLFRDIEDQTQFTTGFVAVRNWPVAVGSPPVVVFDLPAADGDHPAREWQWQCTMLVKDKTTGAIYETMPDLVSESYDGSDYDHTAHPLSSDNHAMFLDRPVTLRRAETAGLLAQPDGWDSYDVLAFNIYRGRGGLFGFVGQTKSRDFVDVGEFPNYEIQPPLGTQPFGDELDGTEHKDRPLTVAFFQERRVFGGSKLRPETVHASVTGDYFNFDSRLAVHVAGEALDFTLASRSREEVRAMLTRQRLLVFTSAAVWSVGGAQGSPIDFDDIDARVEDETGATGLQPIVADGVALFVRSKGVGVRALISDGQQFSFRGVDVSQMAQHLFLGTNRTIVDWCFAQDPWGVVWVVRADGALLSLTHEGDNIGWGRHDTDGLVEGVCSVPEGDEDAVYLVVARNVAGQRVRYIERMTSRVRRYLDTDADPVWPQLYPDKVSLDCALEYSGAPVTGFTGLDLLEGKEVWVVARKRDPAGPFTVQGGAISDVFDELPAANSVDDAGTPIFVAHVGLLFTPQLETLDIASGDARLRKKTVERIAFECDESLGLSVGQSLDPADLDEWIQRDVDDDGFSAISAATVLVDMPVQSNIDQSARGALQQSMPLPVTVVGLTREVDVGE